AVFRCLRHDAGAVRDQARKAVLAIGWERVAAAVEDHAHRGDPETMAVLFDGLAAFEAHRDVVGLLDRLLTVLRGDLRNRALLLLERKRLALEMGKPVRVL